MAGAQCQARRGGRAVPASSSTFLCRVEYQCNLLYYIHTYRMNTVYTCPPRQMESWQLEKCWLPIREHKNENEAVLNIHRAAPRQFFSPMMGSLT